MIDTGGGNRDYMELFKYLFKFKRPKVLMEFGLGYGSKVLREHCDKLVSLELELPRNQGWFDGVVELFDKDEGWKGILIKIDEDKMTDYLKERLIKEIKDINPDMVFVDPGVHFRPEIINICFDLNVPIVSAHDTSVGEDAYHWKNIQVNDYLSDSIGGQGTTLWIKDKEVFKKFLEAKNEK